MAFAPSDNLTAACISGFLANNPDSAPTSAQVFCLTEFTAFSSTLIEATAKTFGGPGIVLGASAPFLLISLIISITRLCKLQNARSIFLMLATLGNLVFVGAIAYALHSSTAEFKRSDQAGLVGLLMMEIFLTMAAVVRFAHVITKTKHRKMFQRGLCVTLLLYGCVLGVQAGREIAASVTQPTIFSRVFIGLFFVPIIVYLIGGLFCFSWNLPSKFQSSSSSAGPDQTFTLLKTLRITNDVMMGLVIALCISELGLVFPLRTSNYNNPVVCLHVTIILFIENVFETVTNGLRGRGVFSGYTSDRPSELSNMRRDELPHPFRSEIGQVAPEVYQPPTASYAGRESWAFGNGGAHTGKSGTGRY